MRIAILVLTACEASTAPPPINAPPTPPSQAPTPTVVTPPPAAPPIAQQLADCDGPDRRLHGTTCCESVNRKEKFPGMTYLQCHGPQVGKACTKKGDCDIACSCDDPHQRLNPRDGANGPKDGTVGVTGQCAGSLQIGVWMCQINEQGAVSHLIVD